MPVLLIRPVSASRLSDCSVLRCLEQALFIYPATSLTMKAIQLACKLVLLTADSGRHTSSSSALQLSVDKVICMIIAQFSRVNVTHPGDATARDSGDSCWFLLPDGIPLDDLQVCLLVFHGESASFTGYFSCRAFVLAQASFVN